ncbi:MAG: glycosyltransferase family 9 protein [Elusimicrobia bacterium]|nr:glycosyltransferase family 9 protein [Candidatus Obscuribacterium magneticum]
MRTYAFKNKTLLTLAKLADTIGYQFRRPPPSKHLRPNKILVIRLDQLGDIVQTLPLFESLRSSYPGAKIHVLSTTAGVELFRLCRTADDYFTWDCPWFDSRRHPTNTTIELGKQLKKEGYDCVLELRGDIRLIWFLKRLGLKNVVGYGATGGGFLLDVNVPWDPNLPAVEKNLRLAEAIGAKSVSATPHMTLIEKSISHLSTTSHSDRRFRLAIHPDAGTPAKRWPLERFRELIIKLHNEGNWDICLIGLNESMGSTLTQMVGPSVTNHMGKTTLPQLLDILQQCDGLLTNDSGPAHLMAALGKPVWTLWSGTADPKIWAPRGNVHIIENPVSCSYCSQATCPVEGHPCLGGITTDKVYDTLLATTVTSTKVG